MRRTYKKLMALCAVLVFSLSLIPVTAFAQDPFTAIAIGGVTGASGAGLFSSMAAMSGVDIGYNSTDPVDAMWNKLNPDHVYFSGEKHEATNVGEDVYDYIKVDIGDWLDAQSDFITNFVTTNNIQDNSSGSVESPLNYNGVYNDYTMQFRCTPGLSGILPGSIAYTITRQSGYNMVTFTYPDSYTVNTNVGTTYDKTYTLKYVIINSQNQHLTLEFWDGNIVRARSYYGNAPLNGATSISYTSGQVDTGVFDNYGSAKISIPSGTLSTGWTVSDFLNGLDTIWANGQEDTIVIEDGDAPPPPTPIPTTPLGEVPFDEWLQSYGDLVSQAAQNIEEDVNDIPGLIEDTNESLTNIDTNISDIETAVDSIDNNVGDIESTVDNIDTNIGVGNGILGGIRTLISGIGETISDIADNIAELVQEVVLATETFIAGLLNTIPIAFGGWFQTMKQSFSIWHYVVEWFNSISGVFGWFWTVANGTSYYIVLPIYASLAGAVVLAFYKRFGK